MGSIIKEYNFKHNPVPWMVDLMKAYLPDVGFFVEIGLGHIVTRESLLRNLENPELAENHTAE